MRTLAAAVASLAACGALAAEEDADFAATKGSAAEAQLQARLKASIRTLPGTDTQYFIGGYLQLDGLATRHRQDGDEQDAFIVSTTPFGPADKNYRAGIRASQLNWISKTPAPFGDFWTRLEANLFPLDGRTHPTLNQLFVRFGEAVTIGKTYSTFVDEDVLPTTLDYNGPSGVTFARQALVRVSLPIAAGWTVAASVEDSQADLDASGTLLSFRTDERRPDIAARVRFEGDFGHVQLAGLSRRIDVALDTPAGTREKHVNGKGVSLSGSLNVGDNAISGQIASGEGIGRYFNDPLSATGVGLGSGSQLDLLRSSGATLYYQHHWAPDWTTIAGASTLRIADEGLARRPEELKRVVYASANLAHRVTPTLIVGAEVLWGQATRVDGATASNTRLQISVRYLVF
ncbi:hypothetical protein DSM104443_02296 [Usitatibacter rugosus]|uniref:Porin n=1 Tax=Usitatibacter rugosus TaxID=2732067 RepID=A0A6M4GXU9_9PROT|nr:hypothetical protein [Usitatibacter rugosus]QJR11223.1 hypothetical protein DSM104443_02296 [Usitatibacter rugosus]